MKSISKWARTLEFQMRSNIFDYCNAFSIFGSLSTIKLYCDTLRIYERERYGCFNFHKESKFCRFEHKDCISFHMTFALSAALTLCKEAAGCHLETFATEDVIADSLSNITPHRVQRLNNCQAKTPSWSCIMLSDVSEYTAYTYCGKLTWNICVGWNAAACIISEHEERFNV